MEERVDESSYMSKNTYYKNALSSVKLLAKNCAYAHWNTIESLQESQREAEMWRLGKEESERKPKLIDLSVLSVCAHIDDLDFPSSYVKTKGNMWVLALCMSQTVKEGKVKKLYFADFERKTGSPQGLLPSSFSCRCSELLTMSE